MFSDIIKKYKWEAVRDKIYSSTEQQTLSVLSRGVKKPEDFFSLLSPASDALLEQMAQFSFRITRMRFGNIMQLYAPLYISNECMNSCAYCGFNRKNDIKRLTLSNEQALAEGNILRSNGFRHILIVSGEHRTAVPPEKIAAIAAKLRNIFSSITIEVYPMETDEYVLLEKSGIDGLTLYQETYNTHTYSEVHPSGKKSDYIWRLDAPDRGGQAGFRKIGVGTLLGLSDWRTDSFFTALHAWYLSKKYWKTQIQISFPRLRHAAGDFIPPHPVNDKDITHLICAMRIMLPDAGLVLSTRENAAFRNNIMPLGITSMSAGSKTQPGGYSENNAGSQFDIDDKRSADEIAEIISKSGFDPVWKDWDSNFIK